MSTNRSEQDPSQEEYSPFNPDLDRQFPQDRLRITPKDRVAIAAGEASPLAWARVFAGSPMQNIEAEILIGSGFIRQALLAGQWVDIPEPSDEPQEPKAFDIGELRIILNAPPMEFSRGSLRLSAVGFAQRVTDESGRVFLKPTMAMMGFINQRIGFNPQ